MAKEQELAALSRQLDEALGQHDLTAAKVDVCGVYKTIKPVLTAALAVLEAVGLGGVAKAIRVLMSIADQFCPA
jgi:hypothetical protein